MFVCCVLFVVADGMSLDTVNSTPVIRNTNKFARVKSVESVALSETGSLGIKSVGESSQSLSRELSDGILVDDGSGVISMDTHTNTNTPSTEGTSPVSVPSQQYTSNMSGAGAESDLQATCDHLRSAVDVKNKVCIGVNHYQYILLYYILINTLAPCF
mgnify:FL=1